MCGNDENLSGHPGIWGRGAEQQILLNDSNFRDLRNIILST